MWRSHCPRNARSGSDDSYVPLALELLSVFFLVGTVGGGKARAGDQASTPSQVLAPKPTQPQPLPFSHKLHTQFVPDCLDCHKLASDGWTMGFPAEEKCMTCHATIKAESPAIKRLAAFYSAKKPVPWVQIYQVPDYVYFSHRTHLNKAKLDCEVCHGPVRERDVLIKERPTSMQACINCHKEKGAPVSCRTCHNSI